MAFIIIDLEFNNLSGITKYYPNIYDEYANLKDIEVENEIIEIGAIKLDNYMKPLEEFKTYIKPTIFPILNPKVSEITNITDKDLQNGVSFKEGINNLRNIIEDGDIICSWAKDDIAQIISNAIYHKYDDLSWINNYLDIQEYSTKILAKKKVLSLKKALEELKIKIDKKNLHDALNDAIYTSFVFKRIYNSRIIRNYIIKDLYNMPVLEVKNLSDFNIDKSCVKEYCPKCKIKIDIEIPLKAMGWRFVSLGKCPKCNNRVINEVQVKKTISGKVVYKEISTIINEVEYMNYYYKINK
ncbi:3'-5' exonuclease [Clostridium septicum]|uniref:Exonuclease n=1 Tax=Clostridium septicum TaxID=1504 RepID=A0A9N7PJL2_CLOSE|nr:3'-5' exonuclease [Clostridium septicum]AYE34800.1 exonuclease [Clostridium septicum]MDU1313384.1 3'-5' exonuclease [Clostridium septicum]QAS60195.1 exonuclease domain-containing protein [Clostridium septicum]UEC20552.1 exonuclease domain-containing protein [Clostridium septicum]USS01394.1 exonuclease domain-containing protein [Clostridium septicum]